MKYEKTFARIGKTAAAILLILLTVAFTLYCITGDLAYGSYSYLGLLYAAPILLVLLILLRILSTKSETRKCVQQAFGLLLLNIPVAIVYLGIGFYLIGVMRIKIVNQTGGEAINLRIQGCDNAEIEQLKNGDSKTVWIDINGDCSISLTYLDENGLTQNETIIGYVTSGMGQKMTYSLGRGETGW